MNGIDLARRTAMVVGCSPNIGSGVAIELARAGAAVACVDRDPQLAILTAKDIADLGGRAIGLGCDATEPGAVSATVDRAGSELGVVDLLVNGAVVYAVKGLLDMDVELWRRQISVILDSAFLFSKAVATRLVDADRPGAILNVVSTAGHQGEAGNIGYTTAKAGLLNMTRSAATELAPHAIRVNSITPTATDPAEGIARALRWGVPATDEATRASLALAAEQVPLRALPTPSDYGRAAAFLCSDAAAMITGADLPVDAGALARYWRVKPVGGP